MARRPNTVRFWWCLPYGSPLTTSAPRSPRTLGVAFLDDPMIRWPFPANATLTDIAALGAVEHGIGGHSRTICRCSSGPHDGLRRRAALSRRRPSSVRRPRTSDLTVEDLASHDTATRPNHAEWLAGHIPSAVLVASTNAPGHAEIDDTLRARRAIYSWLIEGGEPITP